MEHSTMDLRLRPHYLGRLGRYQEAATAVTVAAALLAALLVTVLGPDTWPWPEASGGTLRHVLVGAGVFLLCLAIAGATVEDLNREVRNAATGERDTASQDTKRFVLLLGFTALLTWPTWGHVGQAWQVNDLQAALPVAADVGVRLIPLVLITLVPALGRAWVDERSTTLWHQQNAEQKEDTTATPATEPAPLAPIQ